MSDGRVYDSDVIPADFIPQDITIFGGVQIAGATTEKGMARLAYEYLGSEKFKAFIKSFLQQTDDLYDSAVELIIDRTLETAYGVQLDGIGEIVGIERYPGSDDYKYRWMIKAKILINSTDMTVPNMINLLFYIFGGDNVIHYTLEENLWPTYIINGVMTPEEIYIFSLIPEMLGITTTYVSVQNPENIFSFSEDPTGKGFGDINDLSVGGNFAYMVYSKGEIIEIFDTDT